MVRRNGPYLHGLCHYRNFHHDVGMVSRCKDAICAAWSASHNITCIPCNPFHRSDQLWRMCFSWRGALRRALGPTGLLRWWWCPLFIPFCLCVLALCLEGKLCNLQPEVVSLSLSLLNNSLHPARHAYFRFFSVKMLSRFGIPPELLDKDFHIIKKTFKKW